MGRRDWRWLLAAVGLAGLATPPVHLLLPAFLYLAPAAVLIVRGQDDVRPVRRHFLQGLAFGFGTNLVVLSWLPVALWRLDPGMLWIAGALLIGLGLLTALTFVLSGWLARRLDISLLWILPSLWVALEWIQAHLGPFSFPRLGPAASLSGFPIFLQLADVVGSRGMDGLLAAVNIALGLAWLDRRSAGGRRMALSVAGVTLALVGYGGYRMRTLPQGQIGTASILQPNIGFGDKWDRMTQDSAVASLIAASRMLIARHHPDLVAWPEAAVAGYFQERPNWRESITRLAAQTATPVVVGGLDRDGTGDLTRHFNAAFLFDRSSPSMLPVYHKRRLVPWVEWLPRGRSRSLPFDTYWPGDSGVVFNAGKLRAGTILCIEAAFAGTVRDDRLHGAAVMLNLSNDAWLNGTIGPWQGPAHLVLRAIENRVGIIRASNTGPSQLIGPDGVVGGSTPYGVQTSLTGAVWSSPESTLFTRTGDWAGPLAVIWSLLLIVGAVWTRAFLSTDRNYCPQMTQMTQIQKKASRGDGLVVGHRADEQSVESVKSVDCCF